MPAPTIQITIVHVCCLQCYSTQVILYIYACITKHVVLQITTYIVHIHLYMYTCTYVHVHVHLYIHCSCSTHDEALRPSRHSTFIGVGVGSCEDVPQLRNDGLLSEGVVVLEAQSKVANQTH